MRRVRLKDKIVNTWTSNPACFINIQLRNIYTPNVFSYDEHKKNFDIHFSMKKHTWRMSRLLRRLFWIPPCCVFKNGYFIAKMGQFWWSINIRIEFYLFVSHGGMKDRGSTCKFRKALRALRNLDVDPLSFIPPWETNK